MKIEYHVYPFIFEGGERDGDDGMAGAAGDAADLPQDVRVSLLPTHRPTKQLYQFSTVFSAGWLVKRHGRIYDCVAASRPNSGK